jgi:hypothetical protein
VGQHLQQINIIQSIAQERQEPLSSLHLMRTTENSFNLCSAIISKMEKREGWKPLKNLNLKSQK